MWRTMPRRRAATWGGKLLDHPDRLVEPVLGAEGATDVSGTLSIAVLGEKLIKMRDEPFRGEAAGR